MAKSPLDRTRFKEMKIVSDDFSVFEKNAGGVLGIIAGSAMHSPESQHETKQSLSSLIRQTPTMGLG